MDFSNEELERYSRHIILKEIGYKGQKKLKNARVLVIGAGGLGSPAIMYLASAGVGTIGIADGDVVDLSNLQRQIIHNEKALGIDKAESAKNTVISMNKHIKVNVYKKLIDANNIKEIIEPYDFIIDATDNFEAKFLINDACVLAKKPFSHGGVLGMRGQAMTYIPNKGPCYRCIFDEPPVHGEVPTCKEAGVLGAVCGIIGSIQATEAVKYILGVGGLLNGYMLTVDAVTMEFRKVSLPKVVEDCKICGENPTITTLQVENYERKSCNIN